MSLPFAPRYHPQLLEAAAALDDLSVPIAETCRRVGAVATSLGVPRPSYVHLRRLIHERRRIAELERERREAIRALIEEVATDVLIRGVFVDPYEVADRAAEIWAQ